MTQSMTQVVSKGMMRLSQAFALTGGLIMLSLAIITVASILGRTFIGQSIEGNYELTEVGLAISVFLFLPECYLRQGHVIVDLFTSGCRPATIRFLDNVGHFLFTLVCALFAYRMTLSGIESKDYYEQTMILELPIWWVYVVGVICFSLCALCGALQLFSRNSGEHNE
ncbi:Tripartite ATP-independent periplasmic transporters, DctQ component [Marinomonas gallaica]|uniref:TRAP transporter small permease protein n=1 Tax=Marinomonas gallaica TaxID=1806667 RepID=A0A1C3JNL0_9GAMM|nr:TRAP transporter small permease [Marinomonas gallaica]SBT16647.1 Tripartite ATP-independent periplasmic transporters, DctQ component [Marinomonas gallaica]SBT20363.1 Tripartite ATP-independent periplasmic transporters, DctQ component [Marinomonas gallaica]